ncbi:MAG: gamma-glutamylcyclotransferase family protein [Ferruginibacter sp.]
MLKEVSLLFVYGSLRLGFKDPAYAYLSKFFRLVGEGKVRGKFYAKSNIPVAVSTSENTYIPGDLYELLDNDDFKWVMAQLDDYEGINVEAGETPLYIRSLIKVNIGEAEKEAWIYWYNGNTENLPPLEADEVTKRMI